jgi:hypothetical protein
MKTILALLLLSSTAALASPPNGSLTKEIPGANKRYAGIKNFKMVMPGVLYRGGGTGGKVPLGDAQLDALCADGFTSATYAYKTGWSGPQSATCGNNRISYDYRQWDNASALKSTLSEIHDIIRTGQGAMYVHCWYGVHASGYVVSAALMQFCGYSADQAVAYWNSNVPAKLQYPKVQQKIRAFTPYKEFSISAADQARVCPN